MPIPQDIPGAWTPREKWLRALACCSSDPRCAACPFREENATRSLEDLSLG